MCLKLNSFWQDIFMNKMLNFSRLSGNAITFIKQWDFDI